jgi:hypothetical protein
MIAYDPIDHERDSNVILEFGVELNSTLQKLICMVRRLPLLIHIYYKIISQSTWDS